MTVYRALGTFPAPTGPPDKPPSVTVTLHLTIENFSKGGRGRKPAREQIEAMLIRDYAMMPLGDRDYQLTIAYDTDPDGWSLDDEINHLQTELFNVAESYRCSVEVDIREVGGQQRSW